MGEHLALEHVGLQNSVCPRLIWVDDHVLFRVFAFGSGGFFSLIFLGVVGGESEVENETASGSGWAGDQIADHLVDEVVVRGIAGLQDLQDLLLQVSEQLWGWGRLLTFFEFDWLRLLGRVLLEVLLFGEELLYPNLRRHSQHIESLLKLSGQGGLTRPW